MALEQRQSAKLCGMVQGMELQNSQRAPPIFGWAAVVDCFNIIYFSLYFCVYWQVDSSAVLCDPVYYLGYTCEENLLYLTFLYTQDTLEW